MAPPTRVASAAPMRSSTKATTGTSAASPSKTRISSAHPLRQLTKLTGSHALKKMNDLELSLGASAATLNGRISSSSSGATSVPKHISTSKSNVSNISNSSSNTSGFTAKKLHARPSTAGSTRPKSSHGSRSSAFTPQPAEKTKFRYFYDRGDLPVRVNFSGAVRKIQWQADVSQLDYSHYLPLFMEGLRELEEPYHFLALQGTLDLIEKGDQRPLGSISQLILPMKQNLMTKNPKILCVQMRVLQKLVTCCPFAGEALVPYYRQLLAIFNLFISRNQVNCGDQIDYGQQKQENLSDLIIETLYLLEKHGGANAFVNIKYMIPTYESCMQTF